MRYGNSFTYRTDMNSVTFQLLRKIRFQSYSMLIFFRLERLISQFYMIKETREQLYRHFLYLNFNTLTKNDTKTEQCSHYAEMKMKIAT